MKDEYMHIETTVQLNVADVAFDIGHRMPQKVALEALLQIDEATCDIEFTYKAIRALMDVVVSEALEDDHVGDKTLSEFTAYIATQLAVLNAANNSDPSQSELF